MSSSLAATLAVCGAALAQSAPKPEPARDDSPRFEIRRFIFDGATLVPRERLEADTRSFTGAQRAFSDVQRALAAVERAYAEAGWSAVQVVLPEQELAGGEIRFKIIEARTGRVLVEGNKFFDEANVRASVPSLAPGKAPNINEISRHLRVANENPAKQTQLLLRPGQEERAIDAVLRVIDEKPVKYSVTVDNSGTPSTGRLRVGLGLQDANLSGIDDVLSLQYLTAPYSDHVDESGRPDRYSLIPSRKVTILGLGYRVPFYGRGDSLEFSAGHSNVNSGVVGGLFSVTGAGTIFGARYNANLDKIGDYEHRLSFTLDWRTYDNKGVRVVGSDEQLIPDVTVHPVGIAYSGLYRRQDSETGFSLGVVRNIAGGNDGGAEDFCRLRSNGLGDCAASRYEIWKLSFNHNQALADDFQLRLALNAQRTNDMLVPGEQFGIGGADSVRGFLEREISDDSGIRTTGEVYSPDFGGKTGIAGARMRALLFLDWGRVERNRPAPGEIAAQSIASWGLGLRVSQGTRMAFRIDYAVVLDANASQSATAHTVGSARVHASFSYIF